VDQVNRGNTKVIYCPTDEMIGDFMTKPSTMSLRGILLDSAVFLPIVILLNPSHQEWL